ncbi:hypothetical protein DPMN_118601 [Dreissena polymorpha]|uniref:Uncharacterized protein n=1 Tax=Dreissena polymorpha TaxID=45954 RepID=A0A9D4JR84_DREPO|nr:hypothetical protein DPMN_118601 [Dreissena polymorpha]
MCRTMFDETAPRLGEATANDDNGKRTDHCAPGAGNAMPYKEHIVMAKRWMCQIHLMKNRLGKSGVRTLNDVLLNSRSLQVN